jgi:peptidoglycan/xylan/chitin deacetylase (PgdA/CDA1 family)
MKSKKSTIFILFLLSALILAGVFYWQTKQSQPIPIPSAQNNTPQNNLSSSENEIATSTPPFIVKGEISRGNPAKKQIIFTFDAGAGTNSLQKILETAKTHNLKVTFFSTGKFAEKNPEIIKQIAADGHEIFNHTYSHPHLTQITDEQIKEELDKTEQIISGLTQKTTKPYFRPPYGDRNNHVLEIAKENSYQSVFWTLDALDWMTDKTAEQVKEKIYSNLKNGAIILMHLGDDITGNILDEVFTYIENRGYKIVSLTEGLK